MVTHRSPVRRSTSLASAVSWRCPASFVPPSSMKRTIAASRSAPQPSRWQSAAPLHVAAVRTQHVGAL